MKAMLKSLKEFYCNIFKKKKDWKINTDHRIVPAFISGGVQYYKFEDINNLLCGRAFAALDYYQELEMKCTKEYLTEHCSAVEAILSNSKQINITKLAQLNLQLKERLEMIIAPDILLKIASVVYFDESELPYSYDFKHGAEKINKWKAEKVEDFFLSQPMKDLLPLKNISDQDLETYMKVATQVNKKHLETISTILSGSGVKKDTFKDLELLMG